MGCWLGKAVGGTLGMPYEGVRHTLSLSFYDPVPTEMLPNDDLDLQVVYAFLLNRMAQPRVDRVLLAEGWKHIGMSPDEYGICKRNLAMGLLPPTTGSYDNPFTQGMGAAIRTELWACLAPGNPELASRYAYEDACMDHAGEGIYAAQFLAAVEAMAFIESDRDRLLDAGLTYIPRDCLLYKAISDTRQWWAQTGDWATTQQKLADRYMTDNFTDVIINLAYIVLGWLAGGSDFSKGICAAVNAGQDTDCTGATLGALLGIINPDGIDQRWLTPIGHNMVLSPSITGVDHPPTLEGFTELVLDLRHRIGGAEPQPTSFEQPTDHLAVRATLGSVRHLDASKVPTMPADARQVMLPGQYAHWPSAQCEHDWLLVRYRVKTDAQHEQVRLLFNSPQATKVWLDGALVLQRDEGDFIPAMHRAPKDQLAIVKVSPGEHEIIAAIGKPKSQPQMTWCVGLAQATKKPVCDNWLTGIFDRAG